MPLRKTCKGHKGFKCGREFVTQRSNAERCPECARIWRDERNLDNKRAKKVLEAVRFDFDAANRRRELKRQETVEDRISRETERRRSLVARLFLGGRE